MGRASPADGDLACPRCRIRGDEVPGLSAHSRASLADALATITPALTRNSPGRPPAAVLRAALYARAFNPASTTTADLAAAAALAWAERTSLPVTRLADLVVLRTTLDALAVRLDGHRAAANTQATKRQTPRRTVMITADCVPWLFRQMGARHGNSPGGGSCAVGPAGITAAQDHVDR